MAGHPERVHLAPPIFEIENYFVILQSENGF
jgi:hypothetical protein